MTWSFHSIPFASCPGFTYYAGAVNGCNVTLGNRQSTVFNCNVDTIHREGATYVTGDATIPVGYICFMTECEGDVLRMQCGRPGILNGKLQMLDVQEFTTTAKEIEKC